MPHDTDAPADRRLPVPDVRRERLQNPYIRVLGLKDTAMASLCGSLYGVQSMAAILGVHHITVRKWISGVRPIPLARIPQLAALAREQAAALEALAVRLETVDRPVLEERRRIVRQRQRQTFFDALGFWPEENQVMRRQPPPTTGPKRERWAARRERAAARKGGL